MEKQIIAHAKFLFRQKGYSSISISDIVDAVGITKPTLYYYFKDKEHLYIAVLIDLMERGGQFVRQGIIGQSTLKGRLEQLTEGYFKHSPTSLISIMKDAMEHLGDEGRRQVIAGYTGKVMEPIQDLFQEAIDKGEIAPADPGSLAQAYLSLLDGLHIQKTVLHGRTYDFHREAIAAIGILMDSLTESTSVRQ